MTLGRKPLAWIVALCLLLAQHAAVLHELSHLSTSSAGAQRSRVSIGQDTPAKAAELCLECLAFSAVSTVAGGSAAALLLFSPAATSLVATTRSVGGASPFFAFLARGPPARL